MIDRFRFDLAKERAEEAEARAAREAAEREREATALERRRETAAATALQAWARGVETRQAVSAALEARGLPLLASEQRRRVRTNKHTAVNGDVWWGKRSVSERAVGKVDIFSDDGNNGPGGKDPASHGSLEPEQRTH